MVQLTRVDCAVASAGLMRIALDQAVHHIRHRSVFQRRLVDQPAMRSVAADLALELEANVALVFRLTHCMDDLGDSANAEWSRLMTPAIKYLVCKGAPQFVYEALECVGGNGYSEELPLARYYREAPLNAIWEGSGNVMALDVLRAASRQPEAANRVIDGMARTVSNVCDVSPLIGQIKEILASGESQRRARFACESLGCLAAAATLVETGSPFAGLYARTRLNGSPTAHYGSRDLGTAVETELLDRALAL
jgi:putative acyl-CoA dehydrogenase